LAAVVDSAVILASVLVAAVILEIVGVVAVDGDDTRNSVVLAASTVEIVSLVGGLIAALGIGGIFGAQVQAERDRQERMRERMLDAAGQFLGATMKASSALRQAVVVPECTERKNLIDQANEEYNRAYALVGLLGVLFPPHEADGRTTGGVDPAIRVMNALGAAIRAAAGSDAVAALFEASPELGQSQGAFSRYVNRLAWSRKIKPPRRLVKRRDAPGIQQDGAADSRAKP
jgi:hypothetical protein